MDEQQLHKLSRQAFGGDQEAMASLAAEGIAVVGSLQDGDRFHAVEFPGQVLVYRYGPQRGLPLSKHTHWGCTLDSTNEWCYDGRTPVVLVGR